MLGLYNAQGHPGLWKVACLSSEFKLLNMKVCTANKMLDSCGYGNCVSFASSVVLHVLRSYELQAALTAEPYLEHYVKPHWLCAHGKDVFPVVAMLNRRVAHLPGWLGRANKLPSLIAKLALCCKTRSSPGCLAALTCQPIRPPFLGCNSL